MSTVKPTFVDLFSGCGGLSLGLSKAGWQGEFAIEADPNAFLSFKENFLYEDSEWKFNWGHDWVHKGPNDITQLIKLHGDKLSKLKGTIDLVAGGPPCQGFSVAGKRRANDPRNQLFRYYVDFIKLLQPKMLLLENVGGIDHKFNKDLSGKVGDAFKASDIIKASLDKAGYIPHSKMLYSCDFGVPQRRPRYILIGVRKDVSRRLGGMDPLDLLFENRQEFLFSRKLRSRKGSHVTVKEAISDLETRGGILEDYPGSRSGFKYLSKIGFPESAYQSLMRKGRWRKTPNSLRLANHHPTTRDRFEKIIRACKDQERRGISLSNEMRKSFGMKKLSLTVLDPNKASHTLTTLPDDILHYDEPRILTVREMARIQSFPDSFEFHGKYTTGGMRRTQEVPRYSQVGNAVPPLLAEAIGETLLEILDLSKDSSHNHQTRAA